MWSEFDTLIQIVLPFFIYRVSPRSIRQTVLEFGVLEGGRGRKIKITEKTLTKTRNCTTYKNYAAPPAHARNPHPLEPFVFGVLYSRRVLHGAPRGRLQSSEGQSSRRPGDA